MTFLSKCVCVCVGGGVGGVGQGIQTPLEIISPIGFHRNKQQDPLPPNSLNPLEFFVLLCLMFYVPVSTFGHLETVSSSLFMLD